MQPKKRPKKNPIVIIHDDREKKPWDTDLIPGPFIFKVKRLDTADYTIQGMEDLVRVERKENWEEIVMNLSRSANRKNFIKELRRLQAYPYRAMVIHDEMSRIPYTRVYTESFNILGLYSWVMDIQHTYNIPVFAIGPRKSSGIFLRLMFESFFYGNKNGTIKALT